VRRALSRPWRVTAVLAGVVVLTLPHIGQTWRPNAIGRFFQLPGTPCEAPWRGGAAGWYDCQDRQMWLDRPMSLYALDGVGTAGGVVTAVLVALGLAGCLVLLREGLVAPRRVAAIDEAYVFRRRKTSRATSVP
jgi:hypothetical protein